MENKKKVSLKDYKPNLVHEAIQVTMEELNLNREEAIKFMTEASYELNYGKKRNSIHAVYNRINPPLV